MADQPQPERKKSPLPPPPKSELPNPPTPQKRLIYPVSANTLLVNSETIVRLKEAKSRVLFQLRDAFVKQYKANPGNFIMLSDYLDKLQESAGDATYDISSDTLSISNVGHTAIVRRDLLNFVGAWWQSNPNFKRLNTLYTADSSQQQNTSQSGGNSKLTGSINYNPPITTST